MDKRITNSLVLLMVCFITFRVLGYLIVPLQTAFSSGTAMDEMYVTKNILVALELFSLYGFNLVLGVVLVRLAKNAGFHRGLWFCMGAVFGFFALLLFFILEMRLQYLNKRD